MWMMIRHIEQLLTNILSMRHDDIWIHDSSLVDDSRSLHGRDTYATLDILQRTDEQK